MSYFMVNFMVWRIPHAGYERETYTCDSIQQRIEDVVKRLQDDKNVMDFYQVY